VTFDLRWKAAIGWPVTAKAFHDTTLTYWRKRLAASTDPNRIFAAVQQVIAETGAIKGKTRRALDSTVLDDAVAAQDTVTQLIAAVRRVGREVPGAAEVIAGVTSAHDYDDPGKPRIAGTTRRRATRWSTRWSATRWRCSTRSVSRSRARVRRTRSGCWPWSPGRTSSSLTPTMRVTRRGGGSRARSPRTG
jgi:hypothetical protein